MMYAGSKLALVNKVRLHVVHLGLTFLSDNFYNITNSL